MNGSDLVKEAGTAIFNFTGGKLIDAGTIDLGQPLIQDGGALAPGSAIGQTDILGDYTLDAGSIEIDLGGIGNPHDLLIATGDIDIALLGTTLELSPLGPMIAGTYTIIQTSGGMISGKFENLAGIGIEPGLVDVHYGSNAITITLNQDIVPEPGALSLLIVGMMWGIGKRSSSNYLSRRSSATPPPSNLCFQW